MLIEIECTNLTDFDPATGHSHICGHRMMVDSRMIGELVTCPKCDQDVVVDTAKYRTQPEPAQKATRAQQPSRSQSSSRDASKQQTRKSRTSKSGQPKARAAGTQAEKRVRRSANQVVTPAAAIDQQLEMSAAKADAMIAGSAGTQCRRCGGATKLGKCVKCKSVDPRFINLHRSIETIKPRLAGSQLWFTKTLSEGFSIGTLAIGLHCLVGLATVLMLLLSILGIAGKGIGVVPGVILLIMTILCSSFYAGLVYKGYQFLRRPNSHVAWFQLPFWNALLVLARMQNWTGYDSRLKDRHVLRVRDSSFTDFQIAELEGIRKVAVLDLEGTAVTDQGLALLYRLEHLRCLVVRKTNVTPEGIYRLQQTMPQLWIWR